MRATRNDLTEEVKRKVIKALQERVCLGKLPRGTMKAMATEFELDRGTIRELWRRFQQGCLKSRKYGRTGPTTRYTAEVVIAKIQEIPRIQRSNMRDISEASGISISTISRALKKGIIKRRSSRLKPLLTEENMRERLQYCGAHTLGEEKLSNVFLTLQAVMRLVLEHHGGNGFKLPHLHKDAMKRAGTLMENVSCPVSVLFAAHRFLQQ
ncbi:hypothetical protein DYB30_010981 [Aphanomyces astaci]|uniref:Uncharacterized protein n=1 Tax=Aphanomyces astaci TaxID=112090 RepID=A0A397EQR8_APHAT|nr:hypothetical protein DYB34_010151 [Aphanomyces astaci]RHY71685.1 hypothetical protein DYB38_012937 [Aphanomyces astaci]RHY77874.1 hypothetical protein DYB30_010981 [Aphanomyces astaci]RHY93268.1 hypothetical protein DYB31_016310 [Aphanomyces astaci]RHZ42154.1 hypothetical protein DYB26_015382 [Aphanomyces astaci]